MEIETLARRPAVRRARKLLHHSDATTLDDQLEVVRIPAPPFGESRRAEWLAERFRALGLADVGIDRAGNVLGTWRGESAGDPDPVLVGAHLDTIFEDTAAVRPRRDGDRWIAPGIADNARGLAVMLALARSLAATGVPTRRPFVFLGTVGEEGEGDLRGVKHLFRDDSRFRRGAAFIALDGAGASRIVHRALGARRFRFSAIGPGGHSWADRGRPNPVHALGRAIAEIARIEPPAGSRAAVSVGRFAGGTRVNSIPERAWCEVDVRGADPATLDALADRVREALADACRAENAARTQLSPALTLEVETIGHRPTGETPPDAPLVLAARAATRFIDERPELVDSSTDANVPIALGIPGIALGAGGDAGEIHTRREWFANVRGAAGAERSLLVALAAAGVASG